MEVQNDGIVIVTIAMMVLANYVARPVGGHRLYGLIFGHGNPDMPG